MKFKNAPLIIATITLSLLFVGCQSPPKGKMNDNKFPKSMVGVWETEENRFTHQKWGIKFEEDGSVKKIIHNLAGPINLKEGGVTLDDPKSDDYSVFIMGPCTTTYDPETRIVEVEIVVESCIMKKGDIQLEGSMTDRFTGPVPVNGKVWEAERRTFADFDGLQSFSEEFIENNPDKVTFYKLDLDKPPGSQ